MDKFGETTVGKPSFMYKIATKCTECEINYLPTVNGKCENVASLPKLDNC